MSLKEETLEKNGQRQYEEPDGEFLEMIESGSNTITVLTRVDSDKVGEVDAPFDPVDYTVSELEDSLDSGGGMSESQLRTLIESEKAGKNRKTAIEAIKERL